MTPGEIRCRTLSPGQASGKVVRLGQPLSFWGGVDHAGAVSDRHHPDCGTSLSGKILVMPSGRGSSSSSSVLAELVRVGVAPAGIVLGLPDAIIALGAIAAAELYDIRVPVVVVDPADSERLSSDAVVTVVAGQDFGVISGQLGLVDDALPAKLVEKLQT
ncbi:DUF126 domain-containing protein [Saxibacter everestensis]|uniref:DUF126 domain-containing protein n=1 Tax=Saxibacter everestensis TaxID=2909229 RepID=A0ABY8QRW7_9MICO|nr:DUF126 domain-containing protein [Brevibacteriaceae bacterium ZFBP1038]